MGTISSNNYTIGNANLFFTASIAHASLLATDPSIDLGLGGAFRTSARNLGNIVTTEINPEVTIVEHFISDQGMRKRDLVQANLISITVPFTFDEINENNLTYFFLASDLTTNANWIAPGEKAIKIGSAQLQFETEIGNDFTYFIPKCVIRPNGALNTNAESWWEGPMILDVLYYDTDHWASKPLNQNQRLLLVITIENPSNSGNPKFLWNTGILNKAAEYRSACNDYRFMRVHPSGWKRGASYKRMMI